MSCLSGYNILEPPPIEAALLVLPAGDDITVSVYAGGSVYLQKDGKRTPATTANVHQLQAALQQVARGSAAAQYLRRAIERLQ